MPLPTAELLTLESVKDYLRIDAADTVDDAALGYVVAAVNVKVRQWPVAQSAAADPAPADWAGHDDIVLGATMLAARLWRRRDTPDGVAAFAEGGPAYVQRNDPDVALLLQLGRYTRPAVG